VRRFAQDDGFAEGVEAHLVGCAKQGKIEKVTGSERSAEQIYPLPNFVRRTLLKAINQLPVKTRPIR
jgi:hypothetical protein